ncbi:glutathione S-transferase, N-terminal domain protein [Asticcacaulis biprosthecium C19]|uniref:Glutathione S-transferase, N-terminal domain protein n=1 Tax=Asticcacaulis biprosthecium C19 TaxID=715226 RepID=F4QIF3_9CAUL|nr:glutathione S-transferase N-terminal domain-containing protein [Asticcacaulis biprosthecium]EGF92942.1 glutathione S-transferase, N-terminal domain protein [Asticcacaulis biprosthecium C19]
MLRILGRPSSLNVRKVLWTCDELNLAYDREDWGVGFRPVDTAEFLALNPNGQIPVLIDGDVTLWESNTIIRYLANRHGPQLYPSEPVARAHVDQWLDWQATDLNAAWVYAFLALARRAPGYDDSGRIEASVTAWNRVMAILAGQLTKTGGYVSGPQFRLSDIAIGLAVHRWVATPLAHADLPQVRAYYDRLMQRPAFRTYARSDWP